MSNVRAAALLGLWALTATPGHASGTRGPSIDDAGAFGPPVFTPEQLDAEAEPLDPSDPVARAVAKSRGAFPLVANDVILAALHPLTNTAGGRRNMRAVLQRRGTYATIVDSALAAAGLPHGLAAVPMVESGYTISSPGASYHYGLWCFMPGTARVYGMRVDSKVDERLDPKRETAAAVVYFSRLHQQFGDWALTLIAYNQGDGSLRSAIARAGSRDPWLLIRKGYVKDYAARVMAAALVLEEPSLVADP